MASYTFKQSGYYNGTITYDTTSTKRGLTSVTINADVVIELTAVNSSIKSAAEDLELVIRIDGTKVGTISGISPEKGAKGSTSVSFSVSCESWDTDSVSYALICREATYYSKYSTALVSDTLTQSIDKCDGAFRYYGNGSTSPGSSEESVDSNGLSSHISNFFASTTDRNLADVSELFATPETGHTYSYYAPSSDKYAWCYFTSDEKTSANRVWINQSSQSMEGLSGVINLYACWIYEIILYQSSTYGGTSKLYYRYTGTNCYQESTCENKITQITCPTSSPNGYEFGGYYTEIDGGGTQCISADGTILNALLLLNEPCFLYPYWIPKDYTVTFEPNGGTCSTKSKTATYGSTYGDLPEPTYEGFTFNGWFTAKTSGTQITSSSTVSITDDQTLYAHWSGKYTVKYYYKGVVSSTTSTFVCGETATLPKFSTLGFSSPGETWNFAGWDSYDNDHNSDNFVTTTDGGKVSSLSSTAGVTVNLYLIFSRDATFYGGVKGSEETATRTQYYYSEDTAQHHYVKTSMYASKFAINDTWTAIGWTPETEAVTPVYDFSSDCSEKEYKFYMVYTRTVSITYDANGGTGTTAKTDETQQYSTNGTITTPSFTLAQCGFTRKNYAFNGWDLGAAGSTYKSWTPAVGSTTTTKTATAQWKKSSSAVKIYDGSTWVDTVPYIYTDSGWQQAIAYIYDGTSWKQTTS